MNIQDAIKSEKKVRRKNWVNPEFKEFDLWNDLDSLDILANDWEVEEDKPKVIHLLDSDGVEVSFGWSLDNAFIFDGTHDFSEESVDKILTFLYNNTEIGKSRIIPF